MNLSMHQPSFWVGFVTGILFFWLVLKIHPLLVPIWAAILRRLGKVREGFSAGVEVRFRDDLLRHIQKQHIAAPLFSLDEIALEPFLLAPPPEINLEEQTPLVSSASYILPFLPDWPELGSNLNAPTLTLTEILQGSKGTFSNFAIVGHPGTGKTFALSHLASIVARQQPEAGNLENLLPIFVHIADLNLHEYKNSDPIDTLVNALSIITSAFTQPRLSRLLNKAFSDGRILFLLDGVDELPTHDVDIAISYVGELLTLYPRTRTLVATSTEYFDALIDLGFAPIPMGTWNEYHRRQLIDNWSNLWTTHIISDEQENDYKVEQELIKNWLLDENAAFTPLEFTLKVWAAFSGDTLGPSASDAIEAYIRRATFETPNSREALEEAAFNLLTSSKSVFDPKQIHNFNAFEDIAESGIVIKHTNSQYSIVNPEITGYLAASSLAVNNNPDTIEHSPAWVLSETTTTYLAALGDITPLVTSYLAESDDPLLLKPFRAARWLRHTAQNPHWKSSTLRYFADLLQREKYSFGLRTKAVTALATSGASGVTTLFSQLLNSQDEDIRLLAIFGLGILRDKLLLPQVEAMTNDPSQLVSRAAVLAMRSIGNNQALEGIATALLHGSEEVRRTAAEALASHPAEGYPSLKDGLQNDDLMVRRAVVFGLIQVKEAWAVKLLEKSAVEDGQWVVRNASTQALEAIESPNPYLPRRLPPDSDNPILIEFAGEQGIGLTPGKPATDLIVQILRTGSEEQKLAALYRLRQQMDARMIPEIYHILYGTTGELRESAFNTLWLMSAAGIKLPSPTQFGLG
jgi:HEAT repeat protein